MKPDLIIFTSINCAYLSKALTLYSSLRRNSGLKFKFIIVIVEQSNTVERLRQSSIFEDCEITLLSPEDILDSPVGAWIFKYDVVEACTAIKPKAFKKIIHDFPEVLRILYLDPDIFVYEDMSKLIGEIGGAGALVTPHHIPFACHGQEYVAYSEINSLTYGLYNLGFLLVSNNTSGNYLVSWWDERCGFACYRDGSVIGVFTDQKWFDLAHFSCDLKVSFNLGANVAPWNALPRGLMIEKDGRPRLTGGTHVLFFHFSSFDSGACKAVLLNQCSSKSGDIEGLINNYTRILFDYEKTFPLNREWDFSRFNSGEQISYSHRASFRSRFAPNNLSYDPFLLSPSSLMSEGVLAIRKNSKIVIWGAGTLGMETCLRLRTMDLSPSYFVDSNDQLWDTSLLGISILSPESLWSERDVTLLIATMFHSEVLSEISTKNLNSNISVAIANSDSVFEALQNN